MVVEPRSRSYRPLTHNHTATAEPGHDVADFAVASSKGGRNENSGHDDDREDDGEVYDSESDQYPPEEMEPLAHASTWEEGIRQHHALLMTDERYRDGAAAMAPPALPQPQAEASGGDNDDDMPESYSDEEEDYTDEEDDILQSIHDRPRTTPHYLDRAARNTDPDLQRGGKSGGPPAATHLLSQSVYEHYADRYSHLNPLGAYHESLNESGTNLPNSSSSSLAAPIPHAVALEQVVQTGQTSISNDHTASIEERATPDEDYTLRSTLSEDDGTEHMSHIDFGNTNNQMSGSIQPLAAASTPQANHTSDLGPATPPTLGTSQQPHAESTPVSGPASLPLRQDNSSPRVAPATPPNPEVVLPRWQPDAEVTLCPICGTQFSTFEMHIYP